MVKSLSQVLWQIKGFTEDNVNLAGSVIGSMGAETLKSIQKNYMEKHPHHIPLLFMLDVINGYKTGVSNSACAGSFL